MFCKSEGALTSKTNIDSHWGGGDQGVVCTSESVSKGLLAEDNYVCRLVVIYYDDFNIPKQC